MPISSLRGVGDVRCGSWGDGSSSARQFRRRAGIRRSCGLRLDLDESHAADRTLARLVAHDVRMHRAPIERIGVLERVLGSCFLRCSRRRRWLFCAAAHCDHCHHEHCETGTHAYARAANHCSIFTFGPSYEVVDVVLGLRAVRDQTQVLEPGIERDPTGVDHLVNHDPIGAKGEQGRLDGLLGQRHQLALIEALQLGSARRDGHASASIARISRW